MTMYRCATTNAATITGSHMICKEKKRVRVTAPTSAPPRAARRRKGPISGIVPGRLGAHDGAPVGALVPRQQVAAKRQTQAHEEEAHADQPVQLTRVLERAEEQHAQQVQHQQQDESAGRPMVQPADEPAEQHLVGDVQDALVRLVGGRYVVQRQREAGHDLDDQSEHSRAAEDVEPADAARHAAVEEPVEHAADSAALVDPIEHSLDHADLLRLVGTWTAPARRRRGARFLP